MIMDKARPHLPGIMNKIIQISEPNEINEFCFYNDEAGRLNPVLLPLQVFVFDRTVDLLSAESHPVPRLLSPGRWPLPRHQYCDTPGHFKKLLWLVEHVKRVKAIIYTSNILSFLNGFCGHMGWSLVWQMSFDLLMWHSMEIVFWLYRFKNLEKNKCLALRLTK